ncbi:FmdB family zinc ribbon protein [Gordonia zhaorongruii]|uniref:FmdB family zinc ribbon protein n=1 Tax=Gordonia zhaorongruii TaxID=2597659 RepID=UPI00117F379E|nr:FmdB family zinc ribbon protein [Gordonia zhaorongruii]
MPTYSYACTVCDNKFDIVQSFSEDSLTVCPECGGKLRKLFNSVGVVFKGSGFYRTDSRSNGSVPAKSTESKSSSDSGSSNSGSSSSSDSSNAASA